MLFGGGAINDFAVTLLIGVIVGTYSSIFIATPIVLFWHRQNPVSDDDDEQVVGSIDNEQIEAALFEESPKQA